MYVVPKKAGITVTKNDKGEELQTHLPMKWRACIDYRKLNAATRKDHFALPLLTKFLTSFQVKDFIASLTATLGIIS